MGSNHHRISNPSSRIRRVALVLCLLQALVIVYTVFVLPNLRTSFANEEWVEKRISQYSESGRLPELLRMARKSLSLLQEDVWNHFFILSGVIFISAVANVYVVRRARAE